MGKTRKAVLLMREVARLADQLKEKDIDLWERLVDDLNHQAAVDEKTDFRTEAERKADAKKVWKKLLGQ